MNIDLPPALVTAVSEQRAVLFLGAGASREAIHPRGENIPTGSELRDRLCDHFLAGKLKHRGLSEVAEFAANETSLDEVQLFVTEIFKDFRAAEFHKLIPTFRWHAIITTNLDLVIETAYEQTPDRLQQLIPFFKNGQLIETEMKKYPFPVQYVKLHGCISHPYDREAPFILAIEQYAKWSQQRSRLFDRVRDWGRELPFIFCGYSASDPHIQAILFDLFDVNLHRPSYFCVAPNLEDVEKRYWTRQRVIPIDATFDSFLKALNAAVSKTQRILPRTYSGGKSSLRGYFRVPNPNESDLLISFLSDDVDHIFPDMPIQSQRPAHFYRGYDTGWGCIAQNLDTRRAVIDTVLVDAILPEEEQRSDLVDFYVLKGPAGNGKTVCLKRIAWEAAHEFDKIVLFLKTGGSLRYDAIREIYALTGRRLFCFVDRVAMFHDEVKALLRSCKAEKLPVTIVGAERDNEWNVRCADLDPFVSNEFPVRFLNEREIRDLLDLLEQHRALGLLENLTFPERLDAFVKRAERQLLVALHELTLGRPFEEILVDEYKGISSVEAQLLYLDVCALNRLGVTVRAGLISRVSGIRFEDFRDRFFLPLEHVLTAKHDKYTGDMMYAARHQHVAELVFEQVLVDPEQRFDVLLRLLKGLNLDYACDSSAFWQLVRGRNVGDTFRSQELGRRFYDAAKGVAGEDPYLLQQRAIFEINHEGGSLELAKKYLDAAARARPSDPLIKHSQAVLSRELSLKTTNPLLRQHFREQAFEKLVGLTGPGAESRAYHTKSLLMLDQLRETLEELELKPEDELIQRKVVEITRETERILEEGLQRFPEDSALQTTEGQFRELIDQHEKAERALQIAFSLNPRQDWIAVRLARKLNARRDQEGAIKLLRECLNQNPSSKTAHLEFARILMAKGNIADRPLVLDHLKRSFTEGDANFDAQFWYAREMFLARTYEESSRIFQSLRHAPIEPRLRRRVRALVRDETGGIARFEGKIRRKEATYLLVEAPLFELPLFAHITGSSPRAFDVLSLGSRVIFEVGFSMEGPRAVNVRATDV